MNPRRIFGTVFGVESWIAAVVFAAVVGVMLVAVWRSSVRRRRGAAPSQRSDNRRLEAVYGAAVAAIAIGVVILSFRTTSEERSVAATPAARVDVTGFQWCWRFDYPGKGITVTATCDGEDLPTMVVPVGERVTVTVHSDDVIHSWWVPALRYKMDAFPHHTNRFTFIVDRAGRWIGRCAEFCGDRHYAMDFYLKAVSPEKYRQWLSSGGSSNVTG